MEYTENSEMDLNIDNYSLEDLLNLFHLSPTFTHQDLKNAYKQVWKAHPDKSSLPKEYFIFLKTAVDMLKNLKEALHKEECEVHEKTYIADKDEGMEEIVNRLHQKYSSHEFQDWFNRAFEEAMGDPKERISKEDGYGKWLESSNVYTSPVEDTTLSKEEKWNQLRMLASKEVNQIVVYDEPTSLDLQKSGSLQFEDVQRAYVESVLPVFEEDYVQSDGYKLNQQQYATKRSNQDMQVKPMSRTEADLYFKQQEEKDTIHSAYKTFEIMKQNKDLQERQRQFVQKLHQLAF